MTASAQHAPTALRFHHGDQTIELPAELVETSTSVHTGRELRQLHTEVTRSPGEAEAIRELIDGSPLTDEQGAEWTGRVASESYVQGGPHTLVIEWTEREQVVAELVEFEGFSLRPSAYHEGEEEGIVTITLQASLSRDEMEALWALRADRDRPYWPVVRRGVSEEPRRMRLGRMLWQERDDIYEHQITLVDEAWDHRPESDRWLGLHGEPELGNLMTTVADLVGRFEALLPAFQAGGVLDERAVEEVRQAGQAARVEREYSFYEVENLTRWWRDR